MKNVNEKIVKKMNYLFRKKILKFEQLKQISTILYDSSADTSMIRHIIFKIKSQI